MTRYILISAVCLLITSPTIILTADAKPNFLLIIADDLCWRDLGCTGNPDVKTPNIDRLARQGMTLKHMYTPVPTCSPLRHAIYTGLYPVRSGAYPNHTMVDAGTKSIFTYLKEQGYRVGLQAKSHVSPKSSFPYENISDNADDFEAFTRFITRDKSQPWFAVFASNDPHSPWTRGPKHLYDPAKITIPSYLHDNAKTRELLAAYYAEVSKLDEQVGRCLQAIDDAKQSETTIVAFVSEQGSSFPFGGKWSLYDNGIRSAAFVRWPGKIKAGSSTDALMQYVDFPPTFLEATGVDPTTIDTGCADANGSKLFDGKSILNVLLGKADTHRDVIYAQHTAVGVIGNKEPYPMRAARDARYKLIRNLAPDNLYWINGIHGSEPFKSWVEDAKNDPKLAARVKSLSHRPAEELYDLEHDPFETINLANHSSYSQIKDRLGKSLDAWMTQQGDKGMATEENAKERQPGNRDRSDEPGKNKNKKKAA